MRWGVARRGFILRFAFIPFLKREHCLQGQGRIPDVVLAGIKHLRRQFPSVRVSVEVEKPQRPGLQELAVEADVVFYSKSWALVSLTWPFRVAIC